MPIPEGSKEATFVFEVEGNPRDITFSLGIFDSNIIDPRTNLELANIMRESWTGDGAPFEDNNMPGEYNLQFIQVMEMTETGPVIAQSTLGSTGLGAQEPVPINCALLVRKNTAAGGRRNRGRMYVPPFLPGESQIDRNGFLASGVTATIQGQFDVATAADAAEGIVYLLYHQSGDPEPTEVTSLTVTSQIATQRRRMR